MARQRASNPLRFLWAGLAFIPVLLFWALVLAISAYQMRFDVAHLVAMALPFSYYIPIHRAIFLRDDNGQILWHHVVLAFVMPIPVVWLYLVVLKRFTG